MDVEKLKDYIKKVQEDCKLDAIYGPPEDVQLHARLKGIYMFSQDLLQKIKDGDLNDD